MNNSQTDTSTWQKKKARRRILLTVVLFLFFLSLTVRGFYAGILDRATDKNTLSFWGTLKEKPNIGSGSPDRNYSIYDFELKEYPDVIFEVELPYTNTFDDYSEAGDSLWVTIPLKYVPKLKDKVKSRIFDDYLFSRRSNAVWVYGISSADTAFWTTDNYNSIMLWFRIFPGFVVFVFFSIFFYFIYFTKDDLRDDLAD